MPRHRLNAHRPTRQRAGPQPGANPAAPCALGRTVSTPRLLALVLLLSASAPAWASYRDGAFGLLLLFFAVPGALLALLVAGLMRALDGFRRRRWRRLFQALVAAPAGALMVWVLFSGDGLSTAMIWIGLPLLAALATAPSWWRLAATPPPPAPAGWRHALGLYWIGTGLLPLILSAPALLGAALGRGDVPLAPLLGGFVGVLLVVSGPRLVGGVTLLRRQPGAEPWLIAAIMTALLSLAWAALHSAPVPVLGVNLAFWVADLGIWALGRWPLAGLRP